MPAYLALDGVRPVAVADPDQDRAQAFAADFGFKQHARDYRELIARDDVDIVSVAVPPALHAEITIAALEAGKHVLCEKPMATTTSDAQAMADAARVSGRVLTIDFQMRFGWSTQTARRLISSGELGAPHYARAWYLRRAGLPTWGGFTSKAVSGGGALIDIGVHVIDQALYVLGHPVPRSVWGAVARPFGDRGGVTNQWGPWDTAAYDVDDFAVAALRFDGDLVLTIEAAWILRMGERRVNRLSISAAAGGLELDPLRVFRDRDGYHSIETPEPPQQDAGGHPALIADFVNAVRTGAAPVVSPAEGVLVTQIVEAIYRSSHERREIDL